MSDKDYLKPEHGWTCFHCGETFTTPGSARDHFGFDPTSNPACRIKLGAERGLIMELRKLETEIEDLRRLLHDDASEAYRLYAAQGARHRTQLVAAEELGYERGLASATTRVEDLKLAIDWALGILIQYEPGDSRAVSDAFVSASAISCDIPNDEAREILRKAILLQAQPKETDEVKPVCSADGCYRTEYCGPFCRNRN